MDEFAEAIARIYSSLGNTAKGTFDNMMRVPRGEADREMQENVRSRNEGLINNAFPGGTQQYNEMQENADPERQRKLFGNPYRNAFRALFDK